MNVIIQIETIKKAPNSIQKEKLKNMVKDSSSIKPIVLYS